MGCAPSRGTTSKPLSRLVNANRIGVDDHVDAFGLQDLLDRRGDVLVLPGGQPGALLDDRDPGPEPAVHLGELQRDVAATDDHEMLWHGVEFEHPDIGHVVDLRQPRHIGSHRAATDIEEDLVGLQHAPVDADRVCILEAGVAADERAPVHARQPRLDPIAVAVHDLVFARLHLGHVDADFACADTVFGAAPGRVRGVRAGHQRLGRDAAVVHTGAADQFAFDHGDRLARLRQPTGKRRPGLAGADDDRVELLCHRTRIRRG